MTTHSSVLAFLESLGWPELLVIGIIALLIFGKRLPEVGRSLGRSFVEFKKGLKDTGEELKDIQSDAKRTISGGQTDAADKPQPFNEPAKRNADAGKTD